MKGPTMSQRAFSLVGAFLIALAVVETTSRAQEQSIRRRDVPAKVLKAFQNSYPNASIKGYSKEANHDTVTYEVESIEGEVHRDITYTADGNLISIEESFPFTDLPEPVRDAVTKEYPKAKVTLCEKVIKGSTTQFELLLTSGKQRTELILNPDGTIARRGKK